MARKKRKTHADRLKETIVCLENNHRCEVEGMIKDLAAQKDMWAEAHEGRRNKILELEFVEKMLVDMDNDDTLLEGYDVPGLLRYIGRQEARVEMILKYIRLATLPSIDQIRREYRK